MYFLPFLAQDIEQDRIMVKFVVFACSVSFSPSFGDYPDFSWGASP